MRTYERTHPWLTFSLDLNRASWQLWAKLGECQAMCAQLATVPLRPTTSDELHRVYLAKGALATTAIEGNTLTEEQVRAHLDGKLHLPPSKQYLQQEVDNVVKTFHDLFEQIAGGGARPIDTPSVCEFNKRILKGLSLDDGVVPGELRRHSVVVGTYRGAPAEDCSYLLDRLWSMLDSEPLSRSNEHVLVHTIINAVIAHVYFAWIHPFGDGNGRTARMIEFQILIASGVPTPTAHLLSNHYNLTRTEYIRRLDYASKSGGDLIPFLMYAVQGFLDGLNEQWRYVSSQQLDVAWRNYIHELFRDTRGTSQIRQRHLALDLSRADAPVPLDQMTDLTTRLARAYAKLSHKTLQRDLNELTKRKLVVETPTGFRANRELILAFLPERATME